MSRIFLSHSSVDELDAVALKEWLAANGSDDVFLDIDPKRGLAAGQCWQEALRRTDDRCEAWCFSSRPRGRNPMPIVMAGGGRAAGF